MPDLIDRASEQEERHRAQSLLEYEARRQRERAASGPPPARRRACADCGDPIPRLRLRAEPGTTRCTPCQARQEVR